MANIGASDNGKSFTQLMQEFNEIRVQAFIQHTANADLLKNLEKIKERLLEKLETKKGELKAEIKKAELKKGNLINRLVKLEKVKDNQAQDEIIKELEEYSRIRRYREAQLARIAKDIQNINLTEDQYQLQIKYKEQQSKEALS